MPSTTKSTPAVHFADVLARPDPSRIREVSDVNSSGLLRFLVQQKFTLTVMAENRGLSTSRTSQGRM